MTSFLHPPNQLLATTTYLRPDSSECHPTVSVSLGWGGLGLFLPLPPRAPLPSLFFRPAFSLQRFRLYQNHTQRRSREPVRLVTTRFVRFPCYCSNFSVFREIPGCRLRWTLSFLKGLGWPYNYRCIWLDFPEYVPARACVSAYNAWRIIPWSDSVGRSPYHLSPWGSEGSTNVPLI